jgi:hypothetical protein
MIRGVVEDGDLINDNGLLRWCFSGATIGGLFWCLMLAWSTLVIPLVQLIMYVGVGRCTWIPLFLVL